MRHALLLPLLLLLSGIAAAQPVANFTASSTTGCAPMVVSFTNTSTGSPTSYSWTFGNGNTSTAQNPTTSYTVPGVYTVTLTVSNASGSNTKTQTNYITVRQVPSVSFSASPVAACPGAPISFTPIVTWNAAGTGTYIWDFGDGGSSTSASPTHRYAAPGTYTVKLTAVNSVNCPATDTQANLITIHPVPTADFVASDTAICVLSGTTTFTSTTSGSGTLSYIWDFGDGSPPSTSGSPVTHAYLTGGAFNVRLIATNSFGCSDTETKANYIRVRVVTGGFTAPSAACQGASVSMSTSSSASSGAVVSWNYGDGSATATGYSTAHTYTSSGTFTITQTVTIGGCSTITTRSITINPKPSVSFSYSPLAPCPATVNVQFSTPAASGTTYNWFFGDGFSGSGTSPAHWYTWNDTFTVTLNAYNSFGCAGSASHNIIILPMKLYARSDKKEGCGPLSVSFYDSLITWDDDNVPSRYPHGIATYQWVFGDGNSSSSASPTHTYANPGSYLAQLTVTTSNGCTITDTLRIRVGNLAVPAFGATPRIVCVNDPVRFFDSSTSSGLPINGWKWDFGDGGMDTARNPVYAYPAPDTFDVTLHVGVNGCWDSLKKQQYIVVNFPKSVMNYRVSCDTLRLVHFKDSSKGATSHIWYFGDGTTSTASHPSHQYAASGMYVVSLVTYNNATGCKDSLATMLNLNQPTLFINSPDTTLCKGDLLRMNATISGGASAGQYAWWIGTGGTPVFNYGLGDSAVKYFRMNAGGRYHVALQIIDHNGCKASIQRLSYVVVGAPIAKFSAAPPVGCMPNAIITFTDSTSYTPGTFGVTRAWDFGDGTGATTTSPTITHPYSTTGSYGIILRVTDNLGCMDSLNLANFLVVSDPTALFSTTGSNACVGVPFNFFSSSSGTALKYQWDFGDGGSSTASSPSHAYAATGSYNVRLIVTDAVGCKDTMTKPAAVTVNGRPSASFTMDDTINVCPPLIVNFTNTSTGATRYNWSLGTGATSALQHPSNTYTLPQVYTIRLIATNAAGCHDTAYGRARILGYAGTLSYSPLNGCAPLTVNFKANNVDGVAGFIYDFGDGTTGASTSTTISHVYTKPGPHLPKITLTDNLGCFVTSPGIDTIKVDGVYSGFTFMPFPACDKGTIQFIDTSRGAYSALNPPSWRFHDGTFSSQVSPSKSYGGPGSYNVTLYSSTAAGCKDTLHSKVVFHPLPRIDAGTDTTICLGDSALLQPTGGISYTWTPTATLSCTGCTTPFAFPSVQTRYLVVGTDEHGCTNRDSITVGVRTKVTATVSPGTEICSGQRYTLNATGGDRYEWSPPTGLSDPNSATPVASPMTTQQYMLITRLASCTPDTDYVEIIVHPTPVVDAGKDQTMIAGNAVQLQAVGSSFITNWEWTPDDGLSCVDCSSTEARPKRSTTYIITASTEFNCRAIDSVRVTVLCNNEQVYIPNTFTPEGNGVNDVFYPRGRGLKTINRFRIYNRWGEVVFERLNMAVDDRQQGWDGRKDGRLLSPDVYVYTIDAICDNGEAIRWQGDVMLLR